MKLSKKYSLLLFLLPTLTFAFSLSQSTFGGIISEAISILYILLPLLVATAFIAFFWGLAKFILNSNNEKEVETGKKYMLWGVLALFVLLTFRSIISFISSDLEIGDSQYLPFLPEGYSKNTEPGFNPNK
jgi:hypothetical protein